MKIWGFDWIFGWTGVKVWQPPGIPHVVPSLVLGLVCLGFADPQVMDWELGRTSFNMILVGMWLIASCGFVGTGVLIRNIGVTSVTERGRGFARLIRRHRLVLSAALFFGRSLVISGLEVVEVALLVLSAKDARFEEAPILLLHFAIVGVAAIRLLWVFPSLREHHAR